MAHRISVTGGVALPNDPLLHFLARKPGAPGGGAAGAVLPRAAEDAVGVRDRPVAPEPQRRRSPARRLRVRDEDPSAVAQRVRGRPVRGLVPAIAGAGDPLAPASDDARAEALGQPQSELVRRSQPPVAAP